jgi:hypothetical protein
MRACLLKRRQTVLIRLSLAPTMGLFSVDAAKPVSQALDKQVAIMSNLSELRMIRGIRRKPPLV